ncbi:MAG TPA: nitrous oxide-stimulated promoter family protein [Erysipelotrichaceae bacterium]|nr:nitrous oxide-stimulated promoter family protein [Erysipelotrichaceae bacterium]
MNNTEGKREKEKRVVREMIILYCNGHHHTVHGQLCPDCRELCDYAWQRSDHCPFMETKTFCSNCTVHCYEPAHRERIITIMRWSGPRMIFHHPVMAISHVIASKTEKRKRDILK